MASLATWKSKLDELNRGAASRARSAAVLLEKLGPWLSRYRGGMPAGFLAAIIQFESGGRADAGGDAGLGEFGYLQVAASTAAEFGLPARVRLDPEGNVFLGCLEYQAEAVKMHLARADAVRLGTVDSWKLARLGFAIGNAGTRRLLEGVPAGSRAPWRDLVAHVDRLGGMALGSQEAGKVWYRVHAVDVLWNIGEAVRGGGVGMPERIPAPLGITYTVPTRVAPYLSSPNSALLVALAMAAGAAYLLTS